MGGTKFSGTTVLFGMTTDIRAVDKCKLLNYANQSIQQYYGKSSDNDKVVPTSGSTDKRTSTT